MAIDTEQDKAKVDFQGALNYLMSELELTDSSNLTQSQKTARYKRIAAKIKNSYLHDSDKYKETNRLAMSSLNKYLTRLRTAVRKSNFRHHSLLSDSARSWAFENEDGTKREYWTLAKVIKVYPEYEELLTTLKYEPALTLRKKLKEIAEYIIRYTNPTKRQRELFNILTRKLKVEHEILFHLSLDAAQKSKIKRHQAKSLAKKQSDAVTINRQTIEKIITDNLADKSIYKQAFALALASGRRSIELFKTGSFEFVDNSTVRFGGQAKKRAGVDDAPYCIKTLIPASDFLESFNRFRQSDGLAIVYSAIDEQKNALISMGNVIASDFDNAAINTYTAKSLNTHAKRIMTINGLAVDDRKGGAIYKDTSTQVSFKDSRAIYAAVCLNEYHATDAPQLDDNAYVSSFMGHDAGNAHVHYRQFRINYTTAPAETVNAVERVEPAETVNAVENFDEKVKALQLPPKLLAIHNRTVEWMRHMPDKPLTQTALDKHAKAGNRALICDYLQIEGKRRVELPELLKIIDQYNSNM